MFGIEDPGIWSVYLLTVLCVGYSIWFGAKRWNREDYKEDETTKEEGEL